MTYFILIVILLILTIEILQYLRPESPLSLKPKDWSIQTSSSKLALTGYLEIINKDASIEVMIPHFNISTKLLSKHSTDNFTVKTSIIQLHTDEEIRKDNYWSAYILKSKRSTLINVNIEILMDIPTGSNLEIDNVWIEANWSNYGPFGLINRNDGFVVPVTKPPVLDNSSSYFVAKKEFQLLPIKTHMLGRLDNPADVIENYSSPILQDNDILTIGESPLAIMQGRYVDHRDIKPSLLSRIACKLFHPTSSLATACGMQSLIDIVGPTRILSSIIIGALFKILSVKGAFYRLAGDQARLVDDITGTTPPYDKSIVLGPTSCESFCNHMELVLGVGFAVVDVNDLGKVKILAASRRCNRHLLERALGSNPAGNANQQTPLVIVRPSR